MEGACVTAREVDLCQIPRGAVRKQGPGAGGLGVRYEQMARRAEGEVGAAGAATAGGEGEKGTGRPAREPQDVAVVRSRLDGEVLDLLWGNCHAGGNVVQLRENEGPQGAQGQDGGGGEGLYAAAHARDLLGEVGVCVWGFEGVGQWDADDLGGGLRGLGEVVRHCGGDLVEA